MPQPTLHDVSPPSTQRELPSLDLVFPIIAVALLMMALYVIGVWFNFSEMEERGQFGDMFGGFNALASSLTLVGLAYTIYLQRIELRRAAEDATKQAAALYQQQFDSTFFQLLNVQAGILSDVDINGGIAGRARGRRAFAYARARLDRLYKQHRERVDATREEAAEFAYDDLDEESGGVLGHYFRNLYHIVKFTDDSLLKSAEKKRYTSFVRAQLSADETTVLFFNCQTPRAEKFQPLIEKYALLEHLPEAKFSGADLRLYDIGAYGTSEMLLTKYRWF